MQQEKLNITVTFDVVAVYLEFKKPAATVAAELFTRLQNSDVGVDLISLTPLRRSCSGLSFSVLNRDFSKVLKAAAQLKDENDPLRLEVSGGYAKITLCGVLLAEASDSASGFFRALSAAAPETVLISAADTTLSVLVCMADLDKILAAIEQYFPDAETEYRPEI